MNKDDFIKNKNNNPSDGENGKSVDSYRETAASKLDERLAEFERFLQSPSRDGSKSDDAHTSDDADDRRGFPVREKPAWSSDRVLSLDRANGADGSRNAHKHDRKPERKNVNIHAGHRERMRKTVMHDPTLNALSDVEVLEYVLAHAVPYKDTNPAAHALLDKFGSLLDVIRAPEDEIASVPNVTRNAARLLKLLPCTYESGSVREMDGSTHADVLSFVLSLFVGNTDCGTFAAFFDERFGLTAIEKLAASSTAITNARLCRDVVGSVCKYGSKYVLIASRGKDVFPKLKDLGREVGNVKSVLETVDARLSDYIVVCDFGYYTLGTTAQSGADPEFAFIPLQMFARAPELVAKLMTDRDGETEETE